MRDYVSPVLYTITTAATNGTVTGAGTYDCGEEVTLTATPATGYRFMQWSDGNTDNPRTITLTSDTSLTAIFAESYAGGVLPGTFSVSATKKVNFSQGNLQYQASTGTWRFAEQQYDIIGADNANISSTYSGWIDLFGWSTATTTYGVSTSNDNADYSGSFVDWGQNAISNGGNTANQWSTLSKDEWVYLFQTRSNAYSLCFRASVNGHNGMVVLPDGFVQGSFSYTTRVTDFTTNTYTIAQWQELEAAGAVFLPCADYRSGTSVYNTGNYGHYWTSTLSSSVKAYELYFSTSDIYPKGTGYSQVYFDRFRGSLVRLAQTVKCTVTVTADSNDDSFGSVSGAGTYDCGEEVTLTATPNDCYQFAGWSDGNTDNPRTITVTTDTSLTVEFTSAQITITVESEDVAKGSVSFVIPNPYPEGAIESDFSVGSGKKVCFSKGNLQYTNTGSYNCADGFSRAGTWQFAANQWEVIGHDNANVSSSYTGWIDLFGWGTSGYHNSSDSYNTYFRPYSTGSPTSTTVYNAGYGPSINMTDPNLENSSANYDWGVFCAISNGGNEAGLWCTLSQTEWDYLLTGRTNAANLWFRAQVNGTSGIVLLPDDWSAEGFTFTTGATQFYINDISAAQWANYEAAGAVFLRCAGYRSGVYAAFNLDSYGYYWTSTYYDKDCAQILYFNSGQCNTTYYGRTSGCAVRLVHRL